MTCKGNPTAEGNQSRTLECRHHQTESFDDFEETKSVSDPFDVVLVLVAHLQSLHADLSISI